MFRFKIHWQMNQEIYLTSILFVINHLPQDLYFEIWMKIQDFNLKLCPKQNFILIIISLIKVVWICLKLILIKFLFSFWFSNLCFIFARFQILYLTFTFSIKHLIILIVFILLDQAFILANQWNQHWIS